MAATVQLARDPGLRQRIGAAGTRRAEERYHWAVLANRYLRIYEKLISASP